MLRQKRYLLCRHSNRAQRAPSGIAAHSRLLVRHTDCHQPSINEISPVRTVTTPLANDPARCTPVVASNRGAVIVTVTNEACAHNRNTVPATLTGGAGEGARNGGGAVVGCGHLKHCVATVTEVAVSPQKPRRTRPTSAADSAAVTEVTHQLPSASHHPDQPGLAQSSGLDSGEGAQGDSFVHHIPGTLHADGGQQSGFGELAGVEQVEGA